MTLSRQEIQDQIELNILQTNFTKSGEKCQGWAANSTSVGMYQKLFNGTYYYRGGGVEGISSEIIPNTARYYTIPITPVGVSGLSFVQENVDLNDTRLQSYKGVKNIVDGLKEHR